MAESHIRVTRDGAVATVTIDRAASRNAVTRAMMRDLDAAARSFEADEETRAVVLAAAGEDFSVGLDLKASESAEDAAKSLIARRREAELGARLMRSLQEVRQPTICVLPGVAAGAGACIASACDFRIGTPATRVGYGEVRLGMPLMWNALPVCVALVGVARARRMVMTGRLFDAEKLLSWGFLDEVVSSEGLTATAYALAEELAALPPLPVQMIKRNINALAAASGGGTMHMDADQWLLASQTEDFREAVFAFFEKRRPDFKGR